MLKYACTFCTYFHLYYRLVHLFESECAFLYNIFFSCCKFAHTVHSLSLIFCFYIFTFIWIVLLLSAFISVYFCISVVLGLIVYMLENVMIISLNSYMQVKATSMSSYNTNQEKVFPPVCSKRPYEDAGWSYQESVDFKVKWDLHWLA